MISGPSPRVTLAELTFDISLKTSSNRLHENRLGGGGHFVQYVTCLAVSRETSVLEGTAVTTHNSI